jgi:hypothetical protein
LRPLSKIIPFGGSNHKPILLEFKKYGIAGPIPFRFSPLWIQHEGFFQIIWEQWNTPVTGSPFFVWEENLRRVKKTLKIWAKEKKSSMQSHLEAQQNLETLQTNMEETTITREIIEKEENLHQALHSTCRLEEKYWW